MRKIILLTICCIFIVSCSLDAQDKIDIDQKEIVGKWNFSIKVGDAHSIIKMKGNVQFKPDGESIYQLDCNFIAGDKSATYKVRDLNNWQIDGSYLIENTIETKYYDFEGDQGLIKILKEDGNINKIKENAKIVKLSYSKMKITFKNTDGELIEVLLNRIE